MRTSSFIQFFAIVLTLGIPTLLAPYPAAPLCCAQGTDNAAGAADALAWPPQLTAKEKQQSKILFNAFRKETSLSGQEEAIRSCANLAALALIQKQIQKQLAAPLQEYQKAFSRAAQLKVNAKIKKAQVPAIQQGWQQAAAARKLDYSSGDASKPTLTKELIQSQVQPAFERAYDAFWSEPADIVASDEKLSTLRTELLGKSALWDALGDAWNQLVAPYPGAPTMASLSEMVDQMEFDLVLVALPISEQGRKTLNANRNLTFSLDLEEARCISLTNRYRILLGLAPQAIDLKLCAAARDHSYDMKTRNFFSHESPVAGKKSFSDRAKRMGVSGAGSENIYMGSVKGSAAAEAWFFSPGHHKNMLNDNARIAVGRYQEYFTQMTGWAN